MRLSNGIIPLIQPGKSGCNYPVLEQYSYTVRTSGAKSFSRFGSSIDDQAKILTLTKPTDKTWRATFSYARPAPDQLALDGAMDGHKIQLKLKLQDRDKFTIVNRGFHWINEYPFQR
jgi:hypothetical protein